MGGCLFSRVPSLSFMPKMYQTLWRLSISKSAGLNVHPQRPSCMTKWTCQLTNIYLTFLNRLTFFFLLCVSLPSDSILSKESVFRWSHHPHFFCSLNQIIAIVHRFREIIDLYFHLRWQLALPPFICLLNTRVLTVWLSLDSPGWWGKQLRWHDH